MRIGYVAVGLAVAVGAVAGWWARPVQSQGPTIELVSSLPIKYETVSLYRVGGMWCVVALGNGPGPGAGVFCR